jgi:outer membrane protein with beta-barrel domain
MMKKIALTLVTLIITLGVFGQDTEPNVDEMKEELQNTKDDTTNIRFKRKTVKIIEDDYGTQIFVKKHDRNDDWDWIWDDDKGFTGSWSGFSMGMSNLVDANFSLSRKIGENYMDLNTGKSWNMNLNFAQYSINFAAEQFGLVTGLGLEWNYYRFDNKNSIQKNPITGVIEEKDLSIDKPEWEILESKMSTTFATLPILLEVHSSSSQSKGIVFAGGVIGGVKLGSNTKIVYKENGSKNKARIRDDYNFSPFRYGVHARFGVGNWLVYGTYYFTSMFESNKGPELYPLSIGIALSFE